MQKANCNVNTDERLVYIDFGELTRFGRTLPDGSTELCKGLDVVLQDNPSEWNYDMDASQRAFDTFRQDFTLGIGGRFKSFRACDYWVGNNAHKRHVILQNKLFQIALEDNDWSLAVELLRQPKGRKGLQNQSIDNTEKGILDVLFQLFPVLYKRTGSWQTEAIRRPTTATVVMSIENYTACRALLRANCYDDIDSKLKTPSGIAPLWTTMFADKTNVKAETCIRETPFKRSIRITMTDENGQNPQVYHIYDCTENIELSYNGKAYEVSIVPGFPGPPPTSRDVLLAQEKEG